MCAMSGGDECASVGLVCDLFNLFTSDANDIFDHQTEEKCLRWLVYHSSALASL